MDNFAALILTHGRPDNVMTHKTLRKHGYTGRIVVVVDDTDNTIDEYRAKYGEEVYIFDKKKIAETFDTADNFNDMRTIVYARNASFQIARDLGIKYFVQLDDDYLEFNFIFDSQNRFLTGGRGIKNLDKTFSVFIDFLKSTPTKTIAFAQTGDLFGGPTSRLGRSITLSRKAMNSFFCNVDNEIGFVGRINEDVNIYTRKATTGDLFFTANQIALNQVSTQASDGGMSDVYRAGGTYIKSFYTIMYQPSSVTIGAMGAVSPRLHHRVSWKNTTPMILREEHKK
tara:strand:+ start:74 stop:925 length:852 start_codon:yes stop_codon:yes gene_type:complete